MRKYADTIQLYNCSLRKLPSQVAIDFFGVLDLQVMILQIGFRNLDANICGRFLFINMLLLLFGHRHLVEPLLPPPLVCPHDRGHGALVRIIGRLEIEPPSPCKKCCPRLEPPEDIEAEPSPKGHENVGKTFATLDAISKSAAIDWRSFAASSLKRCSFSKPLSDSVKLPLASPSKYSLRFLSADSHALSNTALFSRASLI